MNLLPSLVCKLVYAHDAWVVGSGANPISDVKELRDWDVVVPFSKWQEAAMLIPKNSRPNTFGGWKCRDSGCDADVWPDDIGMVLSNRPSEWAWSHKTGIRLQVHRT